MLSRFFCQNIIVLYVLQSLVNYYRNEGYLIALDNVGAENCGIQEICALNPDFIKIDMSHKISFYGQ